jgi:hypothetical protein
MTTEAQMRAKMEAQKAVFTRLTNLVSGKEELRVESLQDVVAEADICLGLQIPGKELVQKAFWVNLLSKVLINCEDGIVNQVVAAAKSPEGKTDLKATVSGFVEMIDNALGLGGKLTKFTAGWQEEIQERVNSKAENPDQPMHSTAPQPLTENDVSKAQKDAENQVSKEKAKAAVAETAKVVKVTLPDGRTFEGDGVDVERLIKVTNSKTPRASKSSAGGQAPKDPEAPITGEAVHLGVIPTEVKEGDGRTPTHVEVEKPAGQLSIPFA